MIKCVNGKKLRGLIEQTLKQAYTDPAFANVSFYADMNGDMD